jgi:hypothetical protein
MGISPARLADEVTQHRPEDISTTFDIDAASRDHPAQRVLMALVVERIAVLHRRRHVEQPRALRRGPTYRCRVAFGRRAIIVAIASRSDRAPLIFSL